MSHANRGKELETLIEAANKAYERHGIALIQKIATPTTVVRRFNPITKKSEIVNAFHSDKSTVDFLGTLTGGQAVAFDCKTTMNKQNYRLGSIEPHQIDYLIKFKNTGGLAFFIIEFTMTKEIFRIDVENVKARLDNGNPNMTIGEFRKECQKCSQEADNPLHYLINI
jgi:recombination protein U